MRFLSFGPQLFAKNFLTLLATLTLGIFGVSIASATQDDLAQSGQDPQTKVAVQRTDSDRFTRADDQSGQQDDGDDGDNDDDDGGAPDQGDDDGGDDDGDND